MIYVLYHSNCFDGFGAAFAAWLRYGEDAIYIPVSYGKPAPSMIQGSQVFIVDFSYTAAQIYELSKTMSKVVVLDHHHTAKEELSFDRFKSLIPDAWALEGPPGSWFEFFNCEIHFDMAKSGAVMAWEYFHPNFRVEEFFLYLQDRDLWTFTLPKSREVSMALRSYPMNFKTWSDVSGIVGQGQIIEWPGIRIEDLKKEGVACRRLTEQQVSNMAAGHRWVRFTLPPYSSQANLEFVNGPESVGMCADKVGLITVPVANATVFFSEVGEELLKLNPESPFSAYYFDRGDGKRQWGFRSRPGFDCSEISKHFGGGGHKQAAGFIQTL